MGRWRLRQPKTVLFSAVLFKGTGIGRCVIRLLVAAKGCLREEGTLRECSGQGESSQKSKHTSEGNVVALENNVLFGPAATERIAIGGG